MAENVKNSNRLAFAHIRKLKFNSIHVNYAAVYTEEQTFNMFVQFKCV